MRRYETKRLVSDFKVLGQPVTPEVRSCQKVGLWFWVNNFAINGGRAAIVAPACSSWPGASNDILFVWDKLLKNVDLRSRSG